MLATCTPDTLAGNRTGVSKTPAAQMDDEAAVLTLDEHGVVQDCSGSSLRLFGYRPRDLLQRHVSMLLPQWADVELLRDGRLNSRLMFLCRIGGYFHARSRSGQRIAIDVFLNDLGNPGPMRVVMIVRPGYRDD